MAFYVPLGARGFLFRLGTFVISIWGGLVYRLAYHRRTTTLNKPGPFPSIKYSIEGIFHEKSTQTSTQHPTKL